MCGSLDVLFSVIYISFVFFLPFTRFFFASDYVNVNYLNKLLCEWKSAAWTQKRILILRVGSLSFSFLKCFSTPCITNQSISLSLSLRTQNQNLSTSSLSRRVQLCARPKLSLTPSFVNPSDSRTRRPPPWLGFERCLCCSRRSRWRTASSRRPILGCPPCCSCWRCLLLLFNNNNSVCCVIKERKVFGQFLVSVAFLFCWFFFFVCFVCESKISFSFLCFFLLFFRYKLFSASVHQHQRNQ